MDRVYSRTERGLPNLPTGSQWYDKKSELDGMFDSWEVILPTPYPPFSVDSKPAELYRLVHNKAEFLVTLNKNETKRLARLRRVAWVAELRVYNTKRFTFEQRTLIVLAVTFDLKRFPDTIVEGEPNPHQITDKQIPVVDLEVTLRASTKKRREVIHYEISHAIILQIASSGDFPVHACSLLVGNVRFTPRNRGHRVVAIWKVPVVSVQYVKSLLEEEHKDLHVSVDYI